MRILTILLALTMSFSQGLVLAEGGAAPAAHSIPYKTTETPLEDHGPRVGIVVLLFLLVSGYAIYFWGKKNPKIAANLFGSGSQHLKIIERVRLNSRATLYVVEFDKKKLVIGQAGDNFVSIASSDIRFEEESIGV